MDHVFRLTVEAGTGKKAAVIVTDSLRYIYYQASRDLDLNIIVGDRIREGSVTDAALKKKKIIANSMDDRLFGVSYYAVAMPIYEDSNVKGCVTLVFPDGSSSAGNPIYPHDFLIGKNNGGIFPIMFQDIAVLSSEEGKTYIHSAQGEFQTKLSLMELQYILPAKIFYRCHRGFIVNIKKIREIQPSFHSTFLLHMYDYKESIVPVSQKYASHFRSWLGF